MASSGHRKDIVPFTNYDHARFQERLTWDRLRWTSTETQCTIIRVDDRCCSFVVNGRPMFILSGEFVSVARAVCRRPQFRALPKRAALLAGTGPRALAADSPKVPVRRPQRRAHLLPLGLPLTERGRVRVRREQVLARALSLRIIGWYCARMLSGT